MRANLSSLLASLLVSLGAAACGGAVEVDAPLEPAPASDAGADAVAATDAPEVPYPAPHPGMPEIPNNGGKVLTAPLIVTVTYAGDGLESFAQQLDDWIGGSAWWKTVHADYGVGTATSGGHVVIADPAPDALTDTDLQRWIAAKIDDGTFAQPTDQTLLVIWLPPQTSITLPGAGGRSCASFGGYHSAAAYRVEGKLRQVSYAVIPRCSGRDSLPITVSHELTEAATDPLPGTLLAGSSGWVLNDQSPWNPAGGENADMCEFVSPVTENGYSLTRVWSNANAKIGQQPCIPVPPETAAIPYFNAAITDEILIAKPGDTVSTQLVCYSFGPLAGPLTVSAQTWSQGTLTFSFDPPTCTNGTNVTMTIQVGASATSGTDYHYSLLTQLDANTGHLWRGMVAVP